jgi:hypothetical protein
MFYCLNQRRTAVRATSSFDGQHVITINSANPVSWLKFLLNSWPQAEKQCRGINRGIWFATILRPLISRYEIAFDGIRQLSIGLAGTTHGRGEIPG